MTIIGWIDIEEHLDVRHCKLVIIETMCRCRNTIERALSDRSNLQFIRLKILNNINITDMNEIIIGKAYLSLAPVGG